MIGRELHAGLDRASGVSAIDELVNQLAHVDATLPASDALCVNVGTVAWRQPRDCGRRVGYS